jgi:flagellar basal body-associated protein FliL
MKKVLIALAVVFGVMAIGVGTCSYYVFSKARAFIAPLQQYAALDKNVTNTSKFSAPANGELTEGMVKRFMAVQESMTTKLGPTVNELKAKQDAFTKSQNDEHRQATASENFTVITDMMKFIVQAKTAWAEALNEQRFSIDEYYWVRGRVYAAAGMTLEDMGLRNFTDALKNSGAGGDFSGKITTEIASNEPVPDRNRELVAPYVPKMKDWAVYGFFGL